MASTRAPPRSRTSCACCARRRPRRRRRPSKGQSRRRTRLVCVSAARGALSWLGSDTVARAFCFMSDGTLAPAARVARCWGCNGWGWARGRAAAALFWTSGARGAAAPLEEVMAHLRPWSSRCERVKAASAAFTHEPCSCGSPAPRSGSGIYASALPQGFLWGRGTAPAPRMSLFGPQPGVAALHGTPSTHSYLALSQPRVHRVQCLAM